MFIESNNRSLAKTISWRFWATLTTAALVFLFVGEIKIALSIGAIEVVLKMALYFFHERAWNKIRYGKREIKPAVLWFTGLPAAGKTTLAMAVFKELERKGLKVEHLDGDNIRNIFPKTGFSKEERDRHIKRVGFLASKLEKNGVFVIASFISPYRVDRRKVRSLFEEDQFFEVYCQCDLGICEERDVKGLYKKARSGEIKGYTGISSPYEEPDNAELVLNTDKQSIEECIEAIIQMLKDKNIINHEQ